MLVQGQVGPSSAQSVSPGTAVAVRQGQLGDVIVSELHGRYYEQAYRRNLFSGAIAGATGTTVSALGVVNNTAYTGIVLYNPPGSQVNLVLQKVGYALTVAQAAASAVSIATGFSALPPATTTAIATRNNFVNGPLPIGQLYSAATFGQATGPVVASVPLMTLGFAGTAAITAPMTIPTMYDLEGSIVIPPTGFACIYMSTVSGTNSLIGSFTWEEVPV